MSADLVLRGCSPGDIAIAEGRIAASVNGRIPTTQTLVSLVEAVLDE